MHYIENFDVSESVKDEGAIVTIEKIKYEIAYNLFCLNNELCTDKYESVGEVYWAFPKSTNCDSRLKTLDLEDLVFSFSNLGYQTLPGGLYSSEQILEKYIALRNSIMQYINNL